MSTVILVLFIILVVVLAIILRGWWIAPVLAIMGGSEDPISRVDEFIDKFINDRFTPELAAQMEALSGDISYDIDSLTEKKIRSMRDKNIAAAKLLLDTMLHYYIYDKEPNNISRKAITENKAKLNLLIKQNLLFNAEKVQRVIARVDGALSAGRKDEISVEYPSPRECFRKSKILTLTIGADDNKKVADSLRDELTRKNIELRNKTEELEKAKRTTVGSVFSADLLLDECNRERRLLYEQVYQLKRDIESLKSRPPSGVTESELATLRSRIEDLRNRNVQLETQLRDTERAHVSTTNQITTLSLELANCRQLLEEVLNAAG